MSIRDLSLDVAKSARSIAEYYGVAQPEAQAHIRLATDLLLKAKSHLQTASRIEGEKDQVA